MRGGFGAWVLGVMMAGVAAAGWIVDGTPSRWEGDVAAGEGASYPVFVLSLGGQWTDFELKASTNNFASLVYYIKSSGPTTVADDPDVWVYYTDDYAADPRKWIRSLVATAIGTQLVDAVNSVVEYVVVCPSHGGDVDWRGWMSAENSGLVWSFVRYDGIGLEMNATGTKSRWQPAVPSEWRTARVAP